MGDVSSEQIQAASETRDRIWKAIFDTYYDSYYQEILTHDLINRWQLLDDAAKTTIALTASGSAISGWALWTQPGLRWLWTLLASLGAVLAIFHASLGVASRMSYWTEVRQFFAVLRTDLETFRYRMEINQEFPITQYEQEFKNFRRRYTEGVPRLKNDILLTNRLKERANDRVNARLKDEIA